jgi:hypothetical protein
MEPVLEDRKLADWMRNVISIHTMLLDAATGHVENSYFL